MKKIKKVTLFLLIIFLMSVQNISTPFADEEKMLIKNILVIGSYDTENHWENQVVSGIKKALDLNSNLKFEYIDSENVHSNEYYAEYSKLLNTKYDGEKIDYIITMDDEALIFAIDNLLNENSIFYKTPIFFMGVNNSIEITDEKESYVSGILDFQDTNDFIKLISQASPNVTDIYLVLDESAYCKSLKKSVGAIDENQTYNIKVKSITSNNIEDIEKEIKNIDNFDTSAFILAGTFRNEDGSKTSQKDTIDIIKGVSKAPLFTTLVEYAENGAIGGIINDGNKLGYLGGSYLKAILADSAEKRKYITPTLESMNVFIINYEAMREYNINPLRLPRNVEYINKGRFDYLVPEYVYYIVSISVALILIIIFKLIYEYIKNKKASLKSAIELAKSKEREEIKNNYIIILSHELRTPINIIINTVKLLKNKAINNEYDKNYFIDRMEYLLNNSNRLFKAINDSINVAKLDSNVVDVNFEMMNIVEVIEDVVFISAEFAKQYDIEIIFDPEKEEIDMAIDKEKIRSVMFNFITNSIKNIENEGTIYISCKSDEENVYIEIEDNGVGMSEEVQKHVFEKFFQGSEVSLNRKYEGYGLGMYIASGFINLHGGKINLKSVLGAGTIFKITLPIRIVDHIEEKRPDPFAESAQEVANIEFSNILKNKKRK